MKRYLTHLRDSAQKRTADFMSGIEKDEKSLLFGGLSGDIWEAKPTIYALTTALSVYLDRDSSFYQSAALYDVMTNAVSFVKRTQREDGSFDYPSCNFMSAADTSFCFKRLYAGYRLLEKYGDFPEAKNLKEQYLDIMHHALLAIRNGGFHTPNHRWAIACALMQGASVFADEKEFASGLTERANLYLAEGIDGDRDGQYAERSTGNYNAVVNNAMIGLYQATLDDSYLGFVRRNLSMMLYFIDPDDTIFTQNSSRQDQGKQVPPDKYFYQYLYMCSFEDNSLFDAAAHKIIADNIKRGELAPDCYHIIMLHDEMRTHEFEQYGFLDTYRKFFEPSGVLRVKKEKYAYSVIKGASDFLYFKKGSFEVKLKLGESYCEIRNFIPSSIQMTQNGCILSNVAEGWYYTPFTKPQGTSDWWAMDHTKREKLISSTLTTTVEIAEMEDGLAVTVKTEGIDRLPLRVEVGLPADVSLSGLDAPNCAKAGENMILKAGALKAFIKEGGTFVLEDGFCEHTFKGHYSGEELNTTGFTVYCNAYTPTTRTVFMRVEE